MTILKVWNGDGITQFTWGENLVLCGFSPRKLDHCQLIVHGVHVETLCRMLGLRLRVKLTFEKDIKGMGRKMGTNIGDL